MGRPRHASACESARTFLAPTRATPSSRALPSTSRALSSTPNAASTTGPDARVETRQRAHSRSFQLRGAPGTARTPRKAPRARPRGTTPRRAGAPRTPRTVLRASARLARRGVPHQPRAPAVVHRAGLLSRITATCESLPRRRRGATVCQRAELELIESTVIGNFHRWILPLYDELSRRPRKGSRTTKTPQRLHRSVPREGKTSADAREDFSTGVV